MYSITECLSAYPMNGYFFLYETVVFFYEIGLDLIVSAYILHDVQLFADIVSRPRGASNLRASHCDNERPLPIYTARYTKNHADADASITLMTHVEFCCGLLLRNLLQQQKSVCNHAKMQLQESAQQKWLPVTHTMILF